MDRSRMRLTAGRTFSGLTPNGSLAGSAVSKPLSPRSADFVGTEAGRQACLIIMSISMR